MNAVEGWLVDHEDFFAPAPFDLFDTLMSQYQSVRDRLENMAAAVNSEACAGVLHYFVKGNCEDGGRHTMPATVETLFSLPEAIAELDADFWDRALRLTDVLDYMPQKRRSEWFEQIRNPMGKKLGYSEKRYQCQECKWTGSSHGVFRREDDMSCCPECGGAVTACEWAIEPIPAFTAETVRATLESLIAMRSQFFGERIDGIFQSLSRSHVTNSPKGFRQRMILNRALSGYGYVESGTAGVINDLRCVIAKFMGRDEPKYGATDSVINTAKHRSGKWVSIDGGALRIRVYRGVGTAHLEVHPEIAYRLNKVLASMYPMAIPEEFRERPKREKKVKEHVLFSRPIPFAVLEVINKMKPAFRRATDDRHGNRKFVDIPNTQMFEIGEIDKAAKKQAESILAAIGGVETKDGNLTYWSFEYNPGEVLTDIICSGQIPDHVSHQFYPTPDSVAEQAIALAEEGATDTMLWLEPSAGIGNLADRMPRGRTKCVEISELHAAILRAKGHDVVVADFLGSPKGATFDRIVMNPPYSDGRWQAHLAHAASHLATGGRLVAILPASARGKALLPGFNAVWSDVLANQFENTTVSVVIGVFDRPA